MDHPDTSWCPVCGREIMPKRFLVPVAPPLPPPPPPAPAPPPSSPISSLSKAHSGDAPAVRTTTRTKTGTIRARGGLVHGTGRVKPNGTVKRSDSANAVKPIAVAPPTQPLGPQKHRTVIDQGPTPLYCSDECRMSDLCNSYGIVSHDHDPRREQLSTPPVPHNSYTSIAAVSSESESDSSSGGSSVESNSSASWSSKSSPNASYVSPSIATLADLYKFPPLPPPAPIIEQVDSSDSDSAFDQFQGGIMMAGRRINAALCPEPPKRSSFSMMKTNAPAPSHRPIPGWTDGSDTWRSLVYSLSSPADAPQYPGDDRNTKAYKSTVASPHRSRGVYSTLSESAPGCDHSSSTASLPSMEPTGLQPSQRSTSYADGLYSKYPLSSSRRSESRTSLVMSSSPPTSCGASGRSSSRRRQERSLLKPGAEGKLLVPDVKLKASGLSQSNDSSYDAVSFSSWRSESYYPASSRRSVRSPLSRYGSEISEGGMLQSPHSEIVPLPTVKRPSVETRSWSYDNLMTYPVMPPIPKKEKRIQRQVVDGEEKDIMVEVEITQPMKRLFLFPGKKAGL